MGAGAELGRKDDAERAAGTERKKKTRVLTRPDKMEQPPHAPSPIYHTCMLYMRAGLNGTARHLDLSRCWKEQTPEIFSLTYGAKDEEVAQSHTHTQCSLTIQAWIWQAESSELQSTQIIKCLAAQPFLQGEPTCTAELRISISAWL